MTSSIVRLPAAQSIPSHSVQDYRRTALLITDVDSAGSLFFGSYGRVGYGLHRLKTSANPSAPENVRIANELINHLSVSTKGSAKSLAMYALQWRDFNLWDRIARTTHYDLLAFGVDHISLLWQTFGFDTIRPTCVFLYW